MKRSVKIAGIAGGAVLVGAIGFFTVGPGKDLAHLWRRGVIQQALDDPGEVRQYDASRKSNLKALYTALNLYEKSEDRYPLANGWMDAISGRLRSTDMSEAEASKKLIRPNLPHPTPDQFGYAMNDQTSGKFKGDLKDPKTILIYESSDLKRNAHGSPEKEIGVMAITIGGDVVSY